MSKQLKIALIVGAVNVAVFFGSVLAAGIIPLLAGFGLVQIANPWSVALGLVVLIVFSGSGNEYIGKRIDKLRGKDVT